MNQLIEYQQPQRQRFPIRQWIHRIRYVAFFLFIYGYLQTAYEQHLRLQLEYDNLLHLSPPNELCGGDIHHVTWTDMLLSSNNHREQQMEYQCQQRFKLLARLTYPNPFLLLIEYVSMGLVRPGEVWSDVLQPFGNGIIRTIAYVVVIIAIVYKLIDGWIRYYQQPSLQDREIEKVHKLL